MAVNIKCKGRRGVSQVSLDGFHVVPILEREDGEGVAEIVYPAIWGTNLDGQLLIVIIDRLGAEIVSYRRGEYQGIFLMFPSPARAAQL